MTEQPEGADRAAWIVMAVVLGIAVLLVLGKACTAPITTDEAWSYNDWIQHGPGRIWTDYSAANNHVLHSLFAWVCVRLFGNHPFVLRLPAVAGFMLLLVAACCWLIRHVRNPVCRIATFAALALHPYLLDFGALSRGYALMMGLLATAMILLDMPRKSLVLVASACLGMAIGCVPAALYAAAAIGLVAVVFRALEDRGSLRWFVPALVVPGMAVTVLVYAGVLQQMTPDKFYYGALSVRQSLASLHRVLLYVPQAVVDGLGYPRFDGVPVRAWVENPLLPHGVTRGLVGGVGGMIGLIVGMVTLAVTLWAVRLPKLRRMTAPGLFALLGVEFSFLAFAVTRTRLPLNRTWLTVIPFIILAVGCGADIALRRVPCKRRRVIGSAMIVATLLFLLNGIGRLHPRVYWEWPDNAVIPEVLRVVAGTRGDRTNVSLGYPPYQNACFVYYRERNGLDWLTVAPGTRAAEPVWDFMVVNRGSTEWRDPGGYRPVAAWPPLSVRLFAHRGQVFN